MPPTVCLVVIGRHFAPLRFLDVLLSNEPVFDDATQPYHRLIAGNLGEAEYVAYQDVKEESLLELYSNTALTMLALAASARRNGRAALAPDRRTARLVRELQADDAVPAETRDQPDSILCLGLRTELDALSAEMLAYALTSSGHPRALPLGGWAKAHHCHGGGPNRF